MRAEEIARKLGKATLDGKGWWNCLCPLHKDESPSFSIKEPSKDGNRPPLKCHRGCRTEDIYAELEHRGWLPKREAKKDNVYNFKTLEATYPYVDENEEILFESLKYKNSKGKKSFFQRHKDETGNWINSLENVRRVLFHLPQLLAATKEGQVVFITEGEKDVLTAEELGLVATTNPMGALKWNDTEYGYTKFLEGCGAVFIIPDNDDTGRKHAKQVATAVHKAGIQVHLVPLPGVPEKGDLTDWVQLGHTLDELLDLAAEAPAWEPTPEEPEEYDAGGIGEEGEDVDLSTQPIVFDDCDGEEDEGDAPLGQYQEAIRVLGLGDYPDGDLANGDRFVKRHGERLRYTEVGWVAWNGSYWEIAAKCPKASELAKEVIRVGIKEEIALIKKLSPALAKRLKLWQKKCATTANAVSQMLKMASTDPRINSSLLDFDADPWILNCRNGILDLKTTTFTKGHDPKLLCSKRLNCDYDPDAEAPIFQKALLRSAKGSTLFMSFLLRLFGLTLPGVILEQKLFMLLGPGGSGKSLISNRIFKLMGPYAKNARKQMFMFRNGSESHTDNLGQLRGMRMVVVSEISPRDTFDEGTLKDLSGDDPVTSRLLFGEPFDFMPQCKIFFRSNHKPKVDGTDTGVKRRLIVIPFTEKFDDGEATHENNPPSRGKKPEKIEDLIDRTEQSGILNLCLLGLDDYLENGGLRVPPEVIAETSEYHEENDTFGIFLAECTFHHIALSEVPLKGLRNVYVKFCEENGYFPLNQTNFGKEMKKRGFGKKEVNGRTWYTGIGLKAEAYDPD